MTFKVGYVATEETRARISIASQKYWERVRLGLEPKPKRNKKPPELPKKRSLSGGRLISYRVNLIGRTFTNLTVKEWLGDSSWGCDCSCGGSKIASTYDLNEGTARSCGCQPKRYNKYRKDIEWQATVFARDPVCQGKGPHKGRLEAHHIKPKLYFPDNQFEVSNGVVLCKACHKKAEYKSRELVAALIQKQTFEAGFLAALCLLNRADEFVAKLEEYYNVCKTTIENSNK